MSDRSETGACFCGEIAAEMRGEPFWICYDHDDDRRRALGSPLSIWARLPARPVPPQARSAQIFLEDQGHRADFCANCGTSISYLDEGLQDELYLAIGFLDNPERFQPQGHAYSGMKLPWLEFADGLPRMDGYSRVRDPAFGDPKDR